MLRIAIVIRVEHASKNCNPFVQRA